MPKKDYLNRTVAYYQLVDSAKRTDLPEVDWNDAFRTMGTKKRMHHVFEKEIHGVSVALDVQEHWWDFLEPHEMRHLKTSWHDDTIYALIASTDKDHIPNQRTSEGTLKPMTHDDDAVPATNAFVWFLPFGNIFGVLNEDQSAVSPRYIASWLTKALATLGKLPQANTKFEAVPIVDEDTLGKISRANKFSSAALTGKVRGTDPSIWRDLLLGGPQLNGSFDVKIEIKPRKVGAPQNWEDDAAALYSWFEDSFGSLQGLTGARVKIAKTADQDDLPHGELNLFNHRITRKRKVAIANPNGKVQAISAISAVTQIIEAYLEDFDELKKHR